MAAYCAYFLASKGLLCIILNKSGRSKICQIVGDKAAGTHAHYETSRPVSLRTSRRLAEYNSRGMAKGSK
jgi:hypothetical protein